MLAKNYKIDFLNYWIIESRFEFDAKENLTTNEVANIPIDIDFNILKAEGHQRFKIILTIETACKENVNIPYKFFVKSESIFTINEALEIKTINDILLRTALPLSISYTRGYIANNSTYSPLKRYMLPVVDINELIKMKISQYTSNETKKVVSKSTSVRLRRRKRRIRARQ